MLRSLPCPAIPSPLGGVREMKLRWKHGPALAAAAVALACGMPDAYAVTPVPAGSFGGTQTYVSQTVASNGNIAAIPSGALQYNTTVSTGLTAGDTVTWTTTGS